MFQLPPGGQRTIIAAAAGTASVLALVVAGLIIFQSSDDDGFDAIDPAATSNRPPEITATWDGGLSHVVGTTIDPLMVEATDLDGDPLTFQGTNLPAGIVVDPNTGTLRGTTVAPCECQASVSVRDGQGGSDQIDFTWTVTSPSEFALDDVDSEPDLSPQLPTPAQGADRDPSDLSRPGTNNADTNTTDTPATTTASTPSGDTGDSPGADADANNATTTTTTTTTTSTTAAPTAPAEATPASFQGVHPFDSFFQGRQQYDAWTAGDIAFYAPQGRVAPEVAAGWMDWYVRTDAMYRVVSGRDNFDQVYRRGTPDLGNKKVLAIVETCGAGCGSKQQAEADPGYINAMVGSPNDFQQHWIFFYEMGRGGSPEPWYGRATWPKNTVIIPHLMAGLAFYEFGGINALQPGNIPGDLLAELDRWEQEDIEYIDNFPIADQQSQGGYTSHHLMPAMLWRIRMETDVATVGQITANMAAKPESTSAQQAMCDFRASVNEATGGRFDSRMTGPWGLPDTC
ncbi:MAG: Ig domain-containing protein [Actinomycetota bacterium]